MPTHEEFTPETVDIDLLSLEEPAPETTAEPEEKPAHTAKIITLNFPPPLQDDAEPLETALESTTEVAAAHERSSE